MHQMLASLNINVCHSIDLLFEPTVNYHCASRCIAFSYSLHCLCLMSLLRLCKGLIWDDLVCLVCIVYFVYCVYIVYFVYCVYLCCVYWNHDRCAWIECTGLRKLYVRHAFLCDLEIIAFDMGNHSWPFSNICHIFIFQILVFLLCFSLLA